MNDSTERPDPCDLLATFVASGRSDRAFAALVESLNGLVYSSAMRRTGDSQLAEEVAQNVFTILARRAESLQRHPSLVAWALETTRFQAANARRSERRKRRKLAALSDAAGDHSGHPLDPMDEQASWKDAVPFLDRALDSLPFEDRKLVLARFFEDKKFKEIARQSGRTEAACKKRVQRALRKVSAWMSARGVTLSSTAVASALGAELARPAPAHAAAAAVAPDALAASSSVPSSTLVANSLQTMKTSKTITVATAIVVALAAGPWLHQRAEGQRLQSALDAIAASAVEPAPPRPVAVTALRDQAQQDGGEARGAPPARGLLASLDRPVDNRTLIRSLLGSFFGGDTLRDKLLWSRVARLSPRERRQLIDDLQVFPCEPAAKDFLEGFIGLYAPQVSPREEMERMIAEGRPSVSRASTMEGWASSDPDAALQWYREKRASGALDPGLDATLHNKILSNLILGLAESRPGEAFALYTESPKEEMSPDVSRWLSTQFAYRLMESGDDPWLRKLVGSQRGEDRRAAITGALGTFAVNDEFDAGLAFLERHEPDPVRRRAHLTEMVSGAIEIGAFRQRMDWLIAGTPADEMPAVIGGVLDGLPGRRPLFERWLNEQGGGAVRDRGVASLVDLELESGQFGQALDRSDGIGDASLREATRRRIARAWLDRDREEASRSLPGDLLRRVQNP